MKKKVYFVRHGESEANAKGLHQDETYPLSELGKRQAAFVAERFKTIHIETIISSSQRRALETAEIIHHNNPEGIVISDLFVEFKSPSEIVGVHYKSELSLKIEEEMQKHAEDSTWYYSDEENLHDLKERACRALEFIEKREEEALLVVTHGKFLRMMIAVMMFGDKFRFSDFEIFMRFFVTKNTGITYCTFDTEDFYGQKWRLQTWNDHAHLGEIEEK